MRQSIAVPPDIGDRAERLVREIELEGCSEVEFRRDDAGNAYLMEINPRLWASTEHAVRSGVDFPYLLYQWASGEKIDMVKSYRIGNRLRYLPGHYTATVTAVQQRGKLGVTPPIRAILDFCFSFFIPTGYDYVDWRDPLPAWTAMAGYVRYLSGRIGRRLSRRLPRRKSP
jgi:predicted ATP-grasp superfamily ATP-dependent carboligase